MLLQTLYNMLGNKVGQSDLYLMRMLAVCRTWVLRLCLWTIIQAFSSREGALARNINI